MTTFAIYAVVMLVAILFAYRQMILPQIHLRIRSRLIMLQEKLAGLRAMQEITEGEFSLLDQYVRLSYMIVPHFTMWRVWQARRSDAGSLPGVSDFRNNVEHLLESKNAEVRDAFSEVSMLMASVIVANHLPFVSLSMIPVVVMKLVTGAVKDFQDSTEKRVSRAVTSTNMRQQSWQIMTS